MLNTSPGVPVIVSDDTKQLIEHAIEAKHLTDGRFDATILGDVIRAGYDRSFDRLGGNPHGSSDLSRGSICVLGPTVTIAPGTGFDPGGIGKGLAADMIAQEVIAAGGAGVCVNLGGDVRVEGAAPYNGGWTIGIEYPGFREPFVTLGLSSGAVATSTRLLRRWTADGETRHHLIDPTTGRSAESRLTLVSVVASTAWQAEVFAKACLIDGSLDLVEGTGMDGLAVTEDGTVLSTPGLSLFTGPIPVSIKQGAQA